MSTPDLRRREALKFLIVARQADADPAVGVVYLTALADVAPEFLEAACHKLALLPREDYKPAMPDVGTIRELAESLAREADLDAQFKLLAPMPLAESDEPRFFCLSCRDEPHGWRPFWCPGTGEARSLDRPDRSEGSVVECGKRRGHAPHQYVARCECYETNPVAAEIRRREASFRAKPKRGHAA